MAGQILLDGCNELFDTAKHSSAQPHLRMLVRRIVVCDQVNLLVLGSLPVNEPQKLDPLLMTMLRHAGPDHCPIQSIERCEQRGGGPVALVVMGPCASATRHKREPWLGSVQRLDLALFIHRKHQRVFWWVQVKPDDIAQLLQESRIPAQFEGSSQMGLQTMTPPDAADRARAQPHHLGQAPGAPVGSRYGSLLCCLADDLSNHLVGNRTPPPGARSILQDAVDPLLDKATAPDTYRPTRHPQDLGDLLVLLVFGGQQDNPRSLDDTRRRLTATSKPLKVLPIFCRKNYLGRLLIFFPSGATAFQERITEVTEYQIH